MVSPVDKGLADAMKNAPDVAGDAHPKDLLQAIPEDHEPLQALANNHVVTARMFDRDMLLQLFRLAAKYECNPDRFSTPLDGKIMISAFYEPSTRTRLSFESAWHRLGGTTMSITDRSSTGIAKGESLADVGEMFNNYADCVVLRDHREDSVKEMQDSLIIPIINAGNGTDEHPTQALADVYTILKWKPELIGGKTDPIKIVIVGVPSRMRTVRSLLIMLAHFAKSIREIVIVHADNEKDIFAKGQREELEDYGLAIKTTKDLDKELPDSDVVYINAIAWVKDDFEVMGEGLKLSAKSPLKKDAIILHPLARGDELSTDLDDTPHNWYFAQARGALFIRKALLTCIVQRSHRVMDVI